MLIFGLVGVYGPIYIPYHSPSLQMTFHTIWGGETQGGSQYLGPIYVDFVSKSVPNC